MPTRLYVFDNNGKPVEATELKINGKVILDPSGNPYLVPADFDWNSFIEKFERFEHSLEASEREESILPDEGTRFMRDAAEVFAFLIDEFHAALPGSRSDIQRTYNGHTAKDSGEFVPDFRKASGVRSCNHTFKKLPICNILK